MSRQFDSKIFDAKAFGDYVGRIPSVKLSELIERKVFVGNREMRSLFGNTASAGYAKVPLFGAIAGDAQNYDGITDITPNDTACYEFGAVVIGRANAWSERDFDCDIAGVDYMDNVARQISEYWAGVDEKTLLAVLDGIFTLRSLDVGEDADDDDRRVAKAAFVSAHTYDVSENDNPYVSASSLNAAIQNACGSAKGKFSVVLLHSAVATNLENLQLMNYLTYTDKAGITRDLSIGTWNGKSVIISDSLPTSTDDDGNTVYTSYALGEGAFFYENVGAKVPYEMSRNPSEDGGCDILYSRQRKIFHPFGFDYTKSSQATLSPTDLELAAGVNWELMIDEDGEVVDDKLIPIARIISLG